MNFKFLDVLSEFFFETGRSVIEDNRWVALKRELRHLGVDSAVVSKELLWLGVDTDSLLADHRQFEKAVKGHFFLIALLALVCRVFIQLSQEDSFTFDLVDLSICFLSMICGWMLVLFLIKRQPGIWALDELHQGPSRIFFAWLRLLLIDVGDARGVANEYQKWWLQSIHYYKNNQK